MFHLLVFFSACQEWFTNTNFRRVIASPGKTELEGLSYLLDFLPKVEKKKKKPNTENSNKV
jgi:hypothetical protein